MTKEKLNWTNFTVGENAPEAVQEALIAMEAARKMEADAKVALADYVASKITVPQGHEVKIGTGFGKLSYAVARREARKTVAF